MATWGTQYIGFSYPQDKDAPLEAGKVYQGRFTTPIDIPDNLELPLIKELLKLKYQEPSAEPRYIYVKRKTVIYQWYQRSASPITAIAIFLILVALTLLVLAVGLTLVSLTRVEGVSGTSFLGIDWNVLVPIVGMVIIVIILAVMVIPAVRKPREVAR